MERSLNKWSWQEIIDVYRAYGQQMTEHLELAKRLGFRLPLQSEVSRLRNMHPDRADVVSRTFLHVKRIDHQLDTLEREIERRSALVGVWG